MATTTPNLGLRMPDDNPAGGGDDLVDVTLDIANNMSTLDTIIGNADADPSDIHTRLVALDTRLDVIEGLVHATYVPTLTATTTNPTLGTGGLIQEGWFFQLGKWIVGGWFIRFGTTGAAAGSGTYLVSLPVTANVSNPMRASVSSGLQNVIGVTQYRDDSVPSVFLGACMLHSATHVHMRDSGISSAVVTHASPFAWTASDAITGTFAYIAA